MLTNPFREWLTTFERTQAATGDEQTLGCSLTQIESRIAATPAGMAASLQQGTPRVCAFAVRRHRGRRRYPTFLLLGLLIAALPTSVFSRPDGSYSLATVPSLPV